MIALWIALAVVVAALVVGLVVAVPRRRRGAAGGTGVGVVETQPPEPTATAPRPTPSAAAAPVAEPDGLDVTGVADVVAEAEAVLAEPEAVPAEPEAPEVEALAPAPELRERMGKTRGLFAGAVRALRARGSVDAETWEDLEEALLRADVGVATTTALLDDLRTRVGAGELRGPEAVVGALRQDLRASLDTEAGTDLAVDKDATTVWLFVGVNGVGKTTTIGKVARRQNDAGHSVLLAAGDTFRAAAGEQLELWAERIGVEIVRGAEGGDPSAVVFDAVQRASARGHDLVLADTAGRLHTKVNLVEELKKIRRVADRPPGKVTEVLLVLDATTGQNGLAQARQFLEAVGVTGVVLTKLDGSAKGGIVVAIQRELGIPVKLVGLGEGPADLVPFDADEFVAALFE